MLRYDYDIIDMPVVRALADKWLPLRVKNSGSGNLDQSKGDPYDFDFSAYNHCPPYVVLEGVIVHFSGCHPNHRKNP